MFLVFFAARRGRTAAKVHAGKDENAPNDFRAEDDFERGEAWYEPIVGNDGQESVEKHFPGNQQESVEKHFPGNQQGAVIHGCGLHD